MTTAASAFAELHVSERAPIYAWLSRLLVCEIRASDWEGIRSGPIPAVLIQLEPDLEKELGSALDAEQEERLAEEFARLFLMPGGVSPFASSWLSLRGDEGIGPGAGGATERPLKGPTEQTRDVIASRVALGLQLLGREPNRTEPWGRLPLDHFAVVLDLVSQAALVGADRADQALADQLERELLSPCFTVFGKALGRESRQPIYRAVGRMIAELDTSTP